MHVHFVLTMVILVQRGQIGDGIIFACLYSFFSQCTGRHLRVHLCPAAKCSAMQ